MRFLSFALVVVHAVKVWQRTDLKLIQGSIAEAPLNDFTRSA